MSNKQEILQTKVKGLNKKQLKVLELLDVQSQYFDNMNPKWWKKHSFSDTT